jgi:hypothetical protein
VSAVIRRRVRLKKAVLGDMPERGNAIPPADPFRLGVGAS